MNWKGRSSAAPVLIVDPGFHYLLQKNAILAHYVVDLVVGSLITIWLRESSKLLRVLAGYLVNLRFY